MKQLLASLICSLIVVSFALYALIFHYDACEKVALSISSNAAVLIEAITGESVSAKTQATISETQLSAPKPIVRVVSGSGQLLTSKEDEPEKPTENTGEQYSFDEEFYPYFHMLDSEQQPIYRQIYANALKCETNFVLINPISTSQLTETLSAVYNDHPELFWLDTSYKYGYYNEGTAISLTLSFNDTADNLTMSKQKFESALSLIIEGAKDYESDIEKEKYVHDYLLKQVEYDENAPIHQSAYSALVYHQSVCAGYTRAFQLALRELGIPAYYCTGYTEGNHAWNIVKLSDGYYNVDVSWDDPVNNIDGTLYHDYFNITDEQISRDHRRTELSVNLPECTATTYSYENFFEAHTPSAPATQPDFDRLNRNNMPPSP